MTISWAWNRSHVKIQQIYQILYVELFSWLAMTHCQDDVDKTWHTIGSTWRNSACMDCSCGSCCDAWVHIYSRTLMLDKILKPMIGTSRGCCINKGYGSFKPSAFTACFNHTLPKRSTLARLKFWGKLFGVIPLTNNVKSPLLLMCILFYCRYSTPKSFPDDCMAEFDQQACKYKVFKKNDPSVQCPILSAVGKWCGSFIVSE